MSTWFNEWFWNEHFWLPKNVTWESYKRNENEINYAQFNDIYYSFITALLLIIIRLLFERYLFTPIGFRFGIKEKKRQKLDYNLNLEHLYNSNYKKDRRRVIGTAKQLDWSEMKVERWLKIRSSLDKPTLMKKFNESCWRFTFYTCIFFYGIYVLSNKEWFYDTKYCAINFPHHSVSPEVWFYYNIEMGFYISLLISSASDVKRSDFWQMFIHHIATVILLVFSWACNMHRIGTLVLLIHDTADGPIEITKLLRYIGWEECSNYSFGFFVIIWILTRLILFPYRVIYYTAYKGLQYTPNIFYAYYLFNGLLILLQIFHLIWTWIILKIVYETIFGKGFVDVRESEGSSDESFSDKED